MPTQAADELQTADELRTALLARLTKFAELSGKTTSDVGREAVGDVAFIGDLERGRNITLKTYERARKYLDRKAKASRGSR